MLLTMVDPNRGFERAYNRWYERDHFYAGCMVGPYLFAGSRWVATRDLKDLRWPDGDESVAKPTDGGSYVSIYWVEKEHHDDHFVDFARPQVRWLYANSRGFPERTHVHTVLFDHIGSVYRDADPVPVELALGSRLRRHRDCLVRRHQRRRSRTPREIVGRTAPRVVSGLEHRDRVVVDALGGRKRRAQRADGSGQQRGRPRTPLPAVLPPW